MNIKYPKTEIMCVLGSKVYPLYVTASAEEIVKNMQISHREDFLTFETAVKRVMEMAYGIQVAVKIHTGLIGPLRKILLSHM